MTINNNPNAGMDLFLKLAPPGSEGNEYTQLATNVKGVPIGETSSSTTTVKALLGYSEKDTIGPAIDDVITLASQLSTAFMSSTQGVDQIVQNYLNTLDPTSPQLPPIASLLAVSERSLASGNIGGIQVRSTNVVEDSTTDPYANPNDTLEEDTGGVKHRSVTIDGDSTADAYANPTDTLKKDHEVIDSLSEGLGKLGDEALDNLQSPMTTLTFSKTTGGNPWLGGNVYVGFLVEFMEMQRMMMKNKVVEGEVELLSMDLITELAKTTADLIMQIAKTNQAIHIVSAVMAAASLVMSFVGLGYGFKSAAGSLERGNAITAIGSQTEKMATAIAQAATDVSIAIKEGRKEVLASYRQLSQHQMDKAGESFKASTDYIAQLLQTLDKIREGLQQAVAASLRK